MKGTFKYKISGLVVHLQYGLLMGESIFIIIGSLRLAVTLKEYGGSNDLQKLKNLRITAYAGEFLQISLTNVIHWTLAYKYWRVAWRLGMALKGEDPSQYNRC